MNEDSLFSAGASRRDVLLGGLIASKHMTCHAVGVRFGRPPKLNAHQRTLARREAGETLMDIARSYGVSHPTIMRP